MKNNILVDICWLNETKVRLAGELPHKFVAYMSGWGKGNYARKQKATRLLVSCRKYARMQCYKNNHILL